MNYKKKDITFLIYYFYNTEEVPKSPSATALPDFLQHLACLRLSEYYLWCLLNSSAHLQLPIEEKLFPSYFHWKTEIRLSSS